MYNWSRASVKVEKNAGQGVRDFKCIWQVQIETTVGGWLGGRMGCWVGGCQSLRFSRGARDIYTTEAGCCAHACGDIFVTLFYYLYLLLSTTVHSMLPAHGTRSPLSREKLRTTHTSKFSFTGAEQIAAGQQIAAGYFVWHVLLPL